MRVILIIFQKKIIWGKWIILGPKMVHPHISGSAVRVFFKFCHMKRANRQMKVVIMLCTKKFLLRTNWGILGPEMAHPHNSGLALRIFLKFCRMKGGQQLDENDIGNFFQKIFYLGQMNHLGPKNDASHNSGFALKNFLNFFTLKRVNRQMKVIIMVCTKKIMFLTNGPFWAQKWHILITLDQLEEIFKILQNKKGQDLHENFINCFLRKISIWGNLIFLASRPFFTV